MIPTTGQWMKFLVNRKLTGDLDIYFKREQKESPAKQVKQTLYILLLLQQIEEI